MKDRMSSGNPSLGGTEVRPCSSSEQHRSNKERLRGMIKSLDGFTSYEEGFFLYDLATEVSGKGVVVEIGSWKGRSTVFLAKALQEMGRAPLFAVDPHVGSPEHQKDGPVETFQEFTKNLVAAGVFDQVKPLVMTSQKAASIVTGPVEMVFIDGLHEYEGCNADCVAWLPRVIEGGIIAFHDFDSRDWPGVKRAVFEHIFNNASYDQYRVQGLVLSVRKVSQRRFLTAFLCRLWVVLDRKLVGSKGPAWRIFKTLRKLTRFLLIRY